MIIGIDGSRAFLRQRTGIEEYSYQVIKNLINKLDGYQVVLYIRSGQSAVVADCPIVFPDSWKIKVIKFPRFWTQLGLSLEMFLHPVDVLFVPAHTVPWIHPEKTVVTVHGLEYEMMPEAYSLWERFYMRWSIRNSCRWASAIISVSQNTKKDLMRLYEVSEDKIQVVYEGYENGHSGLEPESSHKASILDSRFHGNDKYLLFIGRLEERKNIIGIIKAFEILKEKYNLPHKLLLAGKGGYGYEKIRLQISNSKFKTDIVELGFVKDEEKFNLIAGAEVFLFPTFYEGFGIPILEAQSVGVPVVTSDLSSLPEIAGDSALLMDPKDFEGIAKGIYNIISDKSLKDGIIEKGYKNISRFSWEKCAHEIAGFLTK